MPRETGRFFGLSLLPETAYGVVLGATSAPKNYEQIAKEGYKLAKYTVTPVTDDGFSTGGDYPTRSAPSVHDVTQDFSERSSPQSIGRRLLDAFGDYSVIPINALGGIYLHTFRPLRPQSDADLVSRTYVEKVSEPFLDADIIHDLIYPGFKCSTFALNSPASPKENGGFLMSASAYMGSGKQLGSAVTPGTGSGIYFEKAPSHVLMDRDKGESFFQSTSGVIRLFPEGNLGGAVVLPGCDFRGLDFSHDNNLLADQGYQGCGKFQDQSDRASGSVRGNLPKGRSQTEIGFTTLVSKGLAQGFNPLRRYRQQSTFSADLTWTGKLIGNFNAVDYYHYLTLEMNKLTIAEFDYDATDTLDMFSIKAATLAAGSAQPFAFKLQNNVPSYLTL